jgi:hypothetical protein
MAGLRVAVVGSCASGKSSVVVGLRERGYDAYAVAQEHSIIPDLWRHLQPDRLVYLHVSLAALRVRRADPGWPAWIYEQQQIRLRAAREHADVDIATDEHDVDGVLAAIVSHLEDEHDRSPSLWRDCYNR